MIDVQVLAVRPHPDQATNNPGCWAVCFAVSRDGEVRTFWRWHTVLKFDSHGSYVTPPNEQPSTGEILKRFWDDTFAALHGFSFNEETP